MEYLTNIPDIAKEHGLCKTLEVRHEVINIKHILTEVFVRYTLDLKKLLAPLNMDLFTYMHIMTNRLRKIHCIDRNFVRDCDEIVKADRSRFFPTIELLKGLNNIIVLDFDGVLTDPKFIPLYLLCCERENVHICSGNPGVTEDWFKRRNLPLPKKIHAMKGKKKKIYRLIELQRKYDNIFYVDNETEYLDYGWVFGLNTFHWNRKQIKHYSHYTE